MPNALLNPFLIHLLTPDRDIFQHTHLDRLHQGSLFYFKDFAEQTLFPLSGGTVLTTVEQDMINQ